MADIIKTLLIGLKKSPQSIVIILIVGGFLHYLHRHDSMELEKVKMVDLVSEQRINHCHQVQEEATEVISKLDQTLINHDKAFTHLLYKLDTFIDAMEKNKIKMDVLLAKMVLLEKTIKEEGAPHADHSKALESIMSELVKMNKKLDNK